MAKRSFRSTIPAHAAARYPNLQNKGLRRKMLAGMGALALASVPTACGTATDGDRVAIDAGAPDAGGHDGGELLLGDPPLPDAGPVDAGPDDAGLPMPGEPPLPDAGPEDAGPPPPDGEAPLPDAG